MKEAEKTASEDALRFMAEISGRDITEVAKDLSKHGYVVEGGFVMQEPASIRKRRGGQGRRWITLEHPRPPRVIETASIYGNNSRPLDISERSKYWVRQIERGWRPNKRIRKMTPAGAAHFFGVRFWEYQNLIIPALQTLETDPIRRVKQVRAPDRYMRS